MHNYVYLQYFFTQLLILFFGYNLTNRTVIGYLTALFTIALSISFLFRILPGYVYFITYAVLILNLFIFIYKKKYIFFLQDIIKNKTKIIIFLIINVFFLLLLHQFHFKNLVYESHDVVYWSPSIELYYSDYIGNIKNFTYFPSRLTAHPLFPTSVLTASSILISDLNLISLLEARYLLICSILTAICFFFYQANKNMSKIKYILIFILFVILLFVFENFFSYSLSFSGIFSLIIFFIFLFNFDNDDEPNIKFNSYLALILTVTKPGIIFIFLIFPIYYFFKFKFIRKDFLFYILSFLVFLNLLTWVLIQSPVANSKIAFFNPFNLSEYFQSLLIVGWIPSGFITQNIENITNSSQYILNFEKNETNLKNILEAYKINFLKINYDLYKILIVFIYFFVIPFYLITKNFKKNNIFSYFLIFSLLIIIFLRNENMFGNKTTSQVAHILYVLPALFTYLLIKSFNKYNYNKFNFFILFFGIIIFSNLNLNFGEKVFSNRNKTPESIVYSDFLNSKNSLYASKGFLSNLVVASKADVLKNEIYSLMTAKRINYQEYNKFSVNFRPIILPWSIDRYHDYIWNSSIIKKNRKSK